jgi:nitrite reductase/ring-hydroxylating ferredoxin subunit
MTRHSPVEIKNVGEVPDLAGRILGGEVFVLRRGLQQLGLFEPLVEGTLEGIRAAAGEEVADKVRRGGFDRIHEWVTPLDLPAVTDSVYAVLTPRAYDHLQALVPRVFPGAGTFYYEQAPNVRFHIPFDLASRYRREFDKFAEKRGQGKIAAHGPHRDQWVDCPANAINIWIAIGPVQQGNSLTVFTEDFETPFAFKDGYILNGERLHKPVSFDLDPGDAVLFLSHHLHGSELNRTSRTRYVVSYRVTFGKPHYPHGHYHHYLHSGVAGGPLRRFAHIPQNLQASFFRYQFRRVRIKLTGRGRMTGADSAAARPTAATRTPLAEPSIPLADFHVGTIRAVAKNACVARLGEHEFAAFSRHCPHSGGDLTAGWVDDGKIVCPLHSLPFDCRTGASPCTSLKALRSFPWQVRDGRVYVSLEQPAAAGRAGTSDHAVTT